MRTAEKQIAKLDSQAQARILNYLKQRVQPLENPCQLGRALHGETRSLWRYRVGDYRIICDIQHQKITVLVLAVAHRKEVYR
jgi:mRNA interferase RelE/StbE